MEAVEADLSRMLVLGAVSATALSTGAFFLRRKDGSVAEGRIYPQDWRYLCEGQHFLLCGPKESTDWGHWGGYVLQLRKGPRGTSSLQDLDVVQSLEWQVGIQRLLSKVAFQPLVLSLPEMVMVPGADVRALDAQLLSARPQELRKQRLDVQEVTGQVAKVRLLRKENLLDAWAPSLSLELLPGCGFQEVEGMPSRHSMAFQLAHGKADRDWNLALFSKEATICRDAVLSSISEPQRGCEVFAKGRHVGQEAREELLQELGLSLEEFAEAAAAVLISPRLRPRAFEEAPGFRCWQHRATCGPDALRASEARGLGGRGTAAAAAASGSFAESSAPGPRPEGASELYCPEPI